MKVHRVVQMVGLTKESGRLASDMYELNDKMYRSESTNEEIPISHMDFQHLIRTFLKLLNKVDNLKGKIETLNELMEEKDDIVHKLLDRPRWAESPTNGHRYVFSEIPNDTDGQEFVDTCKKYLNKPSYKIRVKGQHLKKELYGQGRAYHGANLGDSTHMRVYIDKKTGDE